jgi:hypothetical protein
MGLHCDESLPTYSPPGNVLAVRVANVEQLSDHVAPPNAQMVHFVIVGENTHDEVFWDSVDVKGTARVWWKRNPGRYRTLYLTVKNFTDRNLIHNGKLMLVPGQTFSMDVYWNVKTDDGLYLPTQMDFTDPNQKYCAANVVCAPPETFVIEVSLNVFDHLGYVSAPPLEFTFIARTCVLLGYPPC